METWLTDTFPENLYGQVIIFTDLLPDGSQAPVGYDPANAATDFPSVSVVPTHAAMSALPIAAQGWQKIFGAWKTNGIIQ